MSAALLLYDKAQSSGKGAIGEAEKMAIVQQHSRKAQKEENRERGFLRDSEFLTSRYADREILYGEKVQLMDGVYTVQKIFVAGGAYAALLQPNENGVAKLICRGTALRPTATSAFLSGINDISREIGQLGVQAIWKDVKSHLVAQNIKNIEVLGKSLGGAHAQTLAVLLEGNGITVSHLITVGAVGVADDIHEIFENTILAARKEPFKITVLRNGGSETKGEVDYIPLLGGQHLGAKSTQEKVALQVIYLALPNEPIDTPQLALSSYMAGKRLLASFSKAHIRQTTLHKFAWTTIHGHEEQQAHLRMGETLEGFRKNLARAISLILPSRLIPRPFTEFFNL